MKWFSEEYINRPAVKGNVVQFYLYLLAYPLSSFLAKYHIKPNTITFFSLVFAAISFLIIIADNSYIYFSIFWALSIHLDYCDGTVARMTGNLRQSAFRLDHMTDILKISLIILGVGIRYQDFTIWLLSFSSMFVFMYYTIASHELDSYNKIRSSLLVPESLNNKNEIKKNNFFVLWVKNNRFLSNFYSFFFTLNGHTLLWFFLCAHGILLSKIMLIYFLFLSLFRLKKIVRLLTRLPRLN